MRTFVDLIRHLARNPDRVVLSCEGRHYRGGEVVERSRRIARALLSAGIGRGDRVCLWVGNRVEFVLIELAVTMVGAIFVPIQSRYGAKELNNIVSRAEPALLIYQPGFLRVDLDAILERAFPDAATGRIENVPSLRQIISLDGSRHAGVVRWEDFLEAAGRLSEAKLDTVMSDVDPDDPAICIFTSGTTGIPKGAMLSHGAILTTEQKVGDVLGIAPGERVLYGAPLPSVFGCCNALVASWTHDACLVVMPTFEAGEALDTIENEQCNVIYGVPTMYLTLLNHPQFRPERTASLRSGIVGGAPCPPALADAIIGRLGVRELVSGYGMSETCAVITLTRIGDPVELVTNSVGRPLDGVEVQIWDTASPSVLAADTEGEICVRGSNLMLGYFAGDAGLATPFHDGWFRTGDLGRLRGDGNLRITGRVSDMILVGGFNVYPVEIEAVLASHPDVVQAHVVGIADERMGELPVAFVELRSESDVDPEAISRFCADRIAKYKVPTQFHFVDSFPMTPLGKVQKFELKKMAAKAVTDGRML
ncbi:class I adenylate-forming enzyme family protein [Bradyrhizobium brasilense]|uniref:class I adenylate-forming enzyme family protein n=1 Tax=Bradyrhizobium brasilense TaxID=1419277 RepID=UPI00145638EA|nr:AMP-binding protein [Bradyrhizobium brasilense]